MYDSLRDKEVDDALLAQETEDKYTRGIDELVEFGCTVEEAYELVGEFFDTSFANGHLDAKEVRFYGLEGVS